MSIDKIFLLNKTELIKYLFFCLIISFLICNIIGIEHPIYISFITLVLFFIICIVQIKRDEKKKKNVKKSKNPKRKNVEEKFRVIPELCKKIKPKKSPFEGLTQDELKDKLNYLHYATSHPFKPKSYVNWKKNEKNYIMNPSNSVKHLEISKNDYPELTEDQINYDDCINQIKSSPLSCNQKNPMILDLKKNIKEDFSKPMELIDNFKKPLFKNIPNDEMLEKKPYNLSNDLCSSCVV